MFHHLNMAAVETFKKHDVMLLEGGPSIKVFNDNPIVVITLSEREYGGIGYGD